MLPEVKIVQVRWIDSVISEFEAQSRIQEFRPSSLDSCGFLVVDGEDHLVVAREWSETSQNWRGLIAIPRFAVESIRVLNLSTPYPRSERK